MLHRQAGARLGPGPRSGWADWHACLWRMRFASTHLPMSRSQAPRRTSCMHMQASALQWVPAWVAEWVAGCDLAFVPPAWRPAHWACQAPAQRMPAWGALCCRVPTCCTRPPPICLPPHLLFEAGQHCLDCLQPASHLKLTIGAAARITTHLQQRCWQSQANRDNINQPAAAAHCIVQAGSAGTGRRPNKQQHPRASVWGCRYCSSPSLFFAACAGSGGRACRCWSARRKGCVDGTGGGGGSGGRKP